MTDVLAQLAEYFLKFPGVGKRQAKRFVHFLLQTDPSFRKEFTDLIKKADDDIARCTHCMRFFVGRETEKDICTICDSASRDKTTLIIVEKDSDLDAIEDTETYKGQYFVLGGLLPLLEQPSAVSLNTDALLERLKNDTFSEIIIALAATPEGEQTAEHVRELLKDFKGTISTLGRGLSTGAELEYSDKETIESALKGRVNSK